MWETLGKSGPNKTRLIMPKPKQTPHLWYLCCIIRLEQGWSSLYCLSFSSLLVSLCRIPPWIRGREAWRIDSIFTMVVNWEAETLWLSSMAQDRSTQSWVRDCLTCQWFLPLYLWRLPSLPQPCTVSPKVICTVSSHLQGPRARLTTNEK